MSHTRSEGPIITFQKTESFAAYSLPGSNDFFVTFQDNKSHLLIPPEGLPYFVVAPFIKGEELSRFISADQILCNQTFEISVSDDSPSQSTERAKYLKDVEQIIKDINDERYQKLVYSRVINTDRDRGSVFELFKNLVDQYEQAFVFCYHTPDGGCWMGATPELLIEDDSNGFRSVALAGTQMDLGMSLDRVQWRSKEVEEHQYLKDYIEDSLKQSNIDYQEGLTQTVIAGNVLHISTEFSITRDRSIGYMADTLHPGPAICGTPQRIAQQYILNYEDHERGDYCGYLGLIGVNGINALYVNLRSMRVYKEELQLYVGGGITKDSDPQSEWEETKNKSLTLLNVIQKSYKH